MRAGCAFLFAALIAAAAAAPVDFAQLDPVWTTAPVRGPDAPVVGNGILNASVWLGPNGGLNWELQRRDIPLQLGNCNLQTNGGFDTGEARLDLWNAELRGSLTSERGEVRYLTFVCSNPSVLVIVLNHRVQAGALLSWLPAFHQPVPQVATLAGEVHSVQTHGPGGGAVAVVQRRIESRMDRKVYVIAVEPGADGAAALAAATAVADRAAGLGAKVLLSAHRAQWHRDFRENRTMGREDRDYWLQRYRTLSLGLSR